VHVRRLPGAVPTEAAFTMLYGKSRHAFWLDSAMLAPGLSRFSFLGDVGGPLSEVVRYRVGDGKVDVMAADGTSRRVDTTIFDYLDEGLTRRRVESTDLPFDFVGGYVGYFGYELKADTGSVNKHVASTPDAVWIFADRFIAVDHETDTTYLVCLSDTMAGAQAAYKWLARTASALEALPDVAQEPQPRGGCFPEALEAALVRDRDRYLADIAACKRELLAGESYEICLTNALLLPRPDDGLAFYRAQRRHNPAPYSAYLRLGEVEVACSSPERFLRIDGDRVVESKPIKGTAPRGATEEEDRELCTQLASSTKTQAENLMIVDLLRNDLGRVCEVGSVTVPRLMSTETYATVHQLVSTIRGRLRADVSAVDCVRACFPGGSMTGAPKLRTLEIIDSLETQARGVYSGSIGYLSCNGTADLNIVIRTAVMADDTMHVGAGGAIVLDSDPQEEYEEMLLKSKAPLRALLAGTSRSDLGQRSGARR
jgi:para-aminobenzoate synthetase